MEILISVIVASLAQDMENNFSKLRNNHSNIFKKVLLHLGFHIVMIIKLKNHLMLKHFLYTYYLFF